MSLVKIGFIGAGGLSSRRIYPCLKYAPISLEAVCDLDQAKAEKNARLFGGKRVYTDHRKMFDELDLDAVIVCVAPQIHSQLAIEAMERGLHVYTEKPPAVTAADAKRVLDVSRRTGKTCMTAFKKRFAPAYQKAKKFIEEEGGGLTLLSVDYCSGFYRNDPDNPRSQFLLDFTIHLIDLTRFLGGEVAEVHAFSPDPSTYAISLRFQSGAVGTLAFSSNRSWNVSTEKVELTGFSNHFATIENSTELHAFVDDRIALWHKPSFSTSVGDSLIETGFAGEIVEFATAIQQNREPESSIASSYRTMLLYEAILEAAVKQDRIQVPAG